MARIRGFMVLLLAGICLIPAPAAAEDAAKERELGLGAGASVSTSEYKGEDAGVSPFPIVEFDGEYFFISGLTAGAHVYRDERNDLSLTASYLPQRFDASGNDDAAMRLLDDRDSSVLAGAAYSRTEAWGQARLSMGYDVLGKSNGLTADASYAYPFKSGLLRLKPVVGVEWTNRSYNDYYYGVSSDEAARSGLSEYKADGGFSPYLGLRLKVGLTDSLDLTTGAKAKWLSSEITDSPMVDQDVKYSLNLGLIYSF